MKTNRLIRQIAFLLFVIILFCTSIIITQGQDIKSILESRQFVLQINSLQIPPRLINSSPAARKLTDDQIQFVEPSLNFIDVDSIICTTNLPFQYSFWKDDWSPIMADDFYIIPVTGDISNYKLSTSKGKNKEYVVTFNMKTQKVQGISRVTVRISMDRKATISIADISNDNKLMLRGEMVSENISELK
jgi:hypothetical protein